MNERPRRRRSAPAMFLVAAGIASAMGYWITGNLGPAVQVGSQQIGCVDGAIILTIWTGSIDWTGPLDITRVTAKSEGSTRWLPQYRPSGSSHEIIMPLWVPMLLGAAGASGLLARSNRTASAHRCVACRYDCSGLPAAAPCPECGKPRSPAESGR